MKYQCREIGEGDWRDCSRKEFELYKTYPEMDTRSLPDGPAVKAADVLQAALGHMQDRAATYDKPEGERSMPATVAAFNALTGHTLTAEQGWLFMTVLKLCRTQQGGHRPDNYEDGAAYFALMGEQAACDRAVSEPSVTAWVEHDGKSSPLQGKPGEVQFRNGDVMGSQKLGGDTWFWPEGSTCPLDTVAYRPA